MELTKLIRNKRDIKFTVILNSEVDDVTVDGEERKVTAHEAPLASLDKALSNLREFFAVSLEIPEPQSYAETLQVYGIKITRTKAGTRSVELFAKKELSTRRSMLLRMTSPILQIDKAQEGESGQIEIEGKYLKKVMTAIAECEKYASGDRSQQRLDFDADALNEQVEEGASLFD